MKALVRARPDLVKPIVMPNRTLEGRLVHGIEITQNVNAADGKPVFFQMGVHHAREWPSAEMPMEFADRPGQGLRQERAHHRPGEPRAHHRRARDQPGRLQPLPRGGDRPAGRGRRRPVLGGAVERAARADGHLPARRPPEHQRPAGRADRDQPGQHRGDPGRRADRLRLQAAQLPDRAEQAPGGRAVRRAGQPCARHRPQPQLRRLLGRPGREQRSGRGHLPRQRAVLGARGAERAPDRLQPPGHDADHQPHLLQPRAAPAGRCRRGQGPGRGRLQGARRRHGRGERLRQPVRATSSTTPRGPPRTGATTPPAASASPSRSDRTSSTRPTRRWWPSTRAIPRPRSTRSPSTATRRAATARPT